MRIYLAAPWVHKPAAADAAAAIEAAGHTLTKRWWEHREVPSYGGTIGSHPEDELQELQEQAGEDIKGVLEADAMIVLNLEKSEGKAVEQGLAHAAGLRMLVVGSARLNLFQYLPYVEIYPTLDAALAAL